MIAPNQRTRGSQICTAVSALALLAVFAAPAAAQLVPYGGPIDGWPGYSYHVALEPFAGDELTFPFDANAALIPCDSLFFDNRGPTSPTPDGVWDPVDDTEDSPWFSLGENCTPPCDFAICSIFMDAETDWLPASTTNEVSDIFTCYVLEVCEGENISDISLALDNDAAVWVNGVPGIPGVGQCTGTSADGLCETENCAVLDKVVFTNPAWVTGAVNTIHVRARDRHALAYLDIEVNGDGAGICPDTCVGDDDDDDDDDDDKDEQPPV